MKRGRERPLAVAARKTFFWESRNVPVFVLLFPFVLSLSVLSRFPSSLLDREVIDERQVESDEEGEGGQLLAELVVVAAVAKSGGIKIKCTSQFDMWAKKKLLVGVPHESVADGGSKGGTCRQQAEEI